MKHIMHKPWNPFTPCYFTSSMLFLPKYNTNRNDRGSTEKFKQDILLFEGCCKYISRVKMKKRYRRQVPESKQWRWVTPCLFEHCSSSAYKSQGRSHKWFRRWSGKSLQCLWPRQPGVGRKRVHHSTASQILSPRCSLYDTDPGNSCV